MLKVAQDLGMLGLVTLLFGAFASFRLVRRMAVTQTAKKTALLPFDAVASGLMIGASAISAVSAVLAAASLFFPGV